MWKKRKHNKDCAAADDFIGTSSQRFLRVSPPPPSPQADRYHPSASFTARFAPLGFSFLHIIIMLYTYTCISICVISFARWKYILSASRNCWQPHGEHRVWIFYIRSVGLRWCNNNNNMSCVWSRHTAGSFFTDRSTRKDEKNAIRRHVPMRFSDDVSLLLEHEMRYKEAEAALCPARWTRDGLVRCSSWKPQRWANNNNNRAIVFFRVEF